MRPKATRNRVGLLRSIQLGCTLFADFDSFINRLHVEFVKFGEGFAVCFDLRARSMLIPSQAAFKNGLLPFSFQKV